MEKELFLCLKNYINDWIYKDEFKGYIFKGMFVFMYFFKVFLIRVIILVFLFIRG